MVVLLWIAALAAAIGLEAWGFMLLTGMTHIHILEAVNPISYEVALQFVLVSLPFQAIMGLSKASS